MDLAFLLIADYANTAEGGKLNVMGTFSSISANNFPAVHPEMYVVMQLTAGASEYGREFKLDIKLLDEDAAQEIVSFAVNRVVPTPPAGYGRQVELNHILRLTNVTFPKPGLYEFFVLVDNDTKGRRVVEVRQVPVSE